MLLIGNLFADSQVLYSFATLNPLQKPVMLLQGHLAWTEVWLGWSWGACDCPLTVNLQQLAKHFLTICWVLYAPDEHLLSSLLTLLHVDKIR